MHRMRGYAQMKPHTFQIRSPRETFSKRRGPNTLKQMLKMLTAYATSTVCLPISSAVDALTLSVWLSQEAISISNLRAEDKGHCQSDNMATVATSFEMGVFFLCMKTL